MDIVQLRTPFFENQICMLIKALAAFCERLQRYKPDAKLGTYYSLVLPYPLIFLGVWLVMLVAWYLVGLPIGPGIYPRLN